MHWSYEKRVANARGSEPMSAEVLFDAKSCDFRDGLRARIFWSILDLLSGPKGILPSRFAARRHDVDSSAAVGGSGLAKGEDGRIVKKICCQFGYFFRYLFPGRAARARDGPEVVTRPQW